MIDHSLRGVFVRRLSQKMVLFCVTAFLSGCIDGWDTFTHVQELRFDQVVAAVRTMPGVSITRTYSTHAQGHHDFWIAVRRGNVTGSISFNDYPFTHLEIQGSPFTREAKRLVADLYLAIHRQCPAVTDSPRIGALYRGGT